MQETKKKSTQETEKTLLRQEGRVFSGTTEVAGLAEGEGAQHRTGQERNICIDRFGQKAKDLISKKMKQRKYWNI